MKILITGANGYIGKHVVDSLLDQGHEVIACDIRTDMVNEKANRVNLNLFALPDGNLFELLGKPDVCLHMAWRNGFVHNADSQMEDLSSHYLFLTRLIKDGLKHIAVMGTMHEVGYWEGCVDENTPCNPLSMYGIAKDALRRSMFLFCNNNDCLIQWLRCFYILGDDKKSNSIFCKILKASEEGHNKFPFTKGLNKYDFIDVNYLAKLISKSITQEKITGIINCCTGKPKTLSCMVEQFIADNKLSIQLDYGAYPERPYDSPCIYGDTTKIDQIMNNL